MRKRYLIGGIIIVLFLVFGMRAFMRHVTPYVSIAEARQSHRTIQVSGLLGTDKGVYDSQTHSLRFTLNDRHGDTLLVEYKGVKPANFDNANSVVVIGKYDSGVFKAERLLLKCPSKYKDRTL